MTLWTAFQFAVFFWLVTDFVIDVARGKYGCARVSGLLAALVLLGALLELK